MKLSLVTPVLVFAFVLLAAPSLARAQGANPLIDAPAPYRPPPPPRTRPDQPFPDPDAPYGEPPEPVDAPAPRFGEKGELVVTGSAGMGVSSTEYEDSDASSWRLYFDPSFQYFVTRNLSLGLQLSLSHGASRGYGADGSLVETKTTLVGAGPEVGWNLPLGDVASFWPQASFGLHVRHREERLVSGASSSVANSPLGSGDTSQTGPRVELYLPFLVHPAPHFFLGAGPRVYHDFSRAQGGSDVGGEQTTVGAGLIVGGWWGGPEVDAVTPVPTAPRKKFGDQGQVVLMNDLDLSGSWTHYAGTGSSSSSLGITAGIDCFVADHVSLGAGVTYDRSDTTGLQPGSTQRTQVESVYSTFGVTPRFGVDVPLGDSLSWYPRVAFGFGSRNWDETSGGAENQINVTAAWLSVGAPVLAHLAQHFFIGLGPSLNHDLTSKDESGRSNRGTTVSASALVGGWL